MGNKDHLTCYLCGHRKDSHEGIGGCHAIEPANTMDNHFRLSKRLVACPCRRFFFGVQWDYAAIERRVRELLGRGIAT